MCESGAEPEIRERQEDEGDGHEDQGGNDCVLAKLPIGLAQDLANNPLRNRLWWPVFLGENDAELRLPVGSRRFAHRIVKQDGGKDQAEDAAGARGDDRLVAQAHDNADDRQRGKAGGTARQPRSEEHTSELQSHHDLVCRLLLEQKKVDVALTT